MGLKFCEKDQLISLQKTNALFICKFWEKMHWYFGEPSQCLTDNFTLFGYTREVHCMLWTSAFPPCVSCRVQKRQAECRAESTTISLYFEAVNKRVPNYYVRYLGWCKSRGHWKGINDLLYLMLVGHVLSRASGKFGSFAGPLEHLFAPSMGW